VRRALAQVLALTGYWPRDIPYTLRDLNTTLAILAEK